MKGAHFDELAVFVAVAEQRSFGRAARRLGLSATAVSRRVAALEDRLGARLLNRTTRSVSPTDAGARLMADLGPVLEGLDAACKRAAGRDRGPRGRLRINLPRIAARMVVTPVLPAFARRHPDIELDLVVDEHARDIVADGFDAGIRLGGMVQKDMTAVRLTPDFRMAVVASPAYLRGRAAPAVPADLVAHRCLTYRFAEGGVLQRWAFDSGSASMVVDPASTLTANDTDTLLAAALGGMGLAYLGDLLVAPHVAAGDLVPLLADWLPSFSGFHLYHPGRRLMPPALRAFVDFMREERPPSA